MVRRSFAAATLILILIVAVIAERTSPAAAAATCTVHHVQFHSWSTQDNQVFPDFELQCGGGEMDDYRAEFRLQVQISGTWQQDYCGDAQQACLVYRPTPCCGFYAAGSDHGSWPTGDDWQWNLGQPLHGSTLRVKMVVRFDDGDPAQTYYSSAQSF